jgi:hypothetical protein
MAHTSEAVCLWLPKISISQSQAVHLKCLSKKGFRMSKSIGYKVLASLNERWVTQECYVLAKKTTAREVFETKDWELSTKNWKLE